MGPQARAPGAQRQRARQPSPQEIHAHLDAREKQLKEELKKIAAVRTLMPQPEQPPGRGSSATAPSTRGSIPGVEMALKRSGA